ncbi:MAG: hypothetical protein ACOZQL_02840 [Myxococcota bacterium]
MGGRHVRGVLFVDYVRSIKRNERARQVLAPEAQHFLTTRVELDAWYPMEAFEQLGLAIRTAIVGDDMLEVRRFGREQMEPTFGFVPDLIAEDPREALMRFQVFLAQFFDFRVMWLEEVTDESAVLGIHWGMSGSAEEAACHQALGFLEALVRKAGAKTFEGEFLDRGWLGDARSLVHIQWT